jgi:hypothetical protein
MHRILPCIIILLFVCSLQAYRLEYKITSLGMKVADLQIDMQEDKIITRVQNERRLSLFPHLNNYYEIELDEQIRPRSYLRIIHQSELIDSVLTLYDPPQATMYQKSTADTMVYQISAESRDFFSFICYISRSNKLQGKHLLDGNGAMWQASISKVDQESIKTALGSFEARKLEIRVSPLSQEKAPYIDMLTNNFFSEDIRISIWISEQGFPVKAKMKKKALGMNWEITSIQK